MNIPSRFIQIVWLTVIAIAFGSPVAAIAAPRGDAVASYFQSFCLAAAPSWQQLSAVAALRGLKLVMDRRLPFSGGLVVLQRNWLVNDATGQFMVIATGSEGPIPKETIGCGVVALDGSEGELVASLLRLPQLGMWAKHVDGLDGSSTSFWFPCFDEGTAELMLISKIPGQPGVLLQLNFHPKGKG